jgi:hypothetical protein
MVLESTLAPGSDQHTTDPRGGSCGDAATLERLGADIELHENTTIVF